MFRRGLYAIFTAAVSLCDHQMESSFLPDSIMVDDHLQPEVLRAQSHPSYCSFINIIVELVTIVSGQERKGTFIQCITIKSCLRDTFVHEKCVYVGVWEHVCVWEGCASSLTPHGEKQQEWWARYLRSVFVPSTVTKTGALDPAA